MRYALGIAILQVLWLASLGVGGDARLPVVAVLIAGELLIPAVAERVAGTGWHSRHIADRYGYLHYFVFAAAGAFSAGIGVQVDMVVGQSTLSDAAASLVVVAPIALFIIGIWWLVMRASADRVVNVVVPVGALAVLANPLLPTPTVLPLVVTALIVATLVVRSPAAA